MRLNAMGNENISKWIFVCGVFFFFFIIIIVLMNKMRDEWVREREKLLFLWFLLIIFQRISDSLKKKLWNLLNCWIYLKFEFSFGYFDVKNTISHWICKTDVGVFIVWLWLWTLSLLVFGICMRARKLIVKIVKKLLKEILCFINTIVCVRKHTCKLIP